MDGGGTLLGDLILGNKKIPRDKEVRELNAGRLALAFSESSVIESAERK